MGETEVVRESIHENLQKRDNGRHSDTDVLRTVILVVGFVLFIPGLIYLAYGSVATVMSSGPGSEDYLTYMWLTNIIGLVSTAGAVIAGYLLVRIARKRSAYSVKELLCPAVVVVGAYMVLLAATQSLYPIAFYYVFVGGLRWSAAFSGLFQLPYFVGGLLLVMIGRHRFLVRR